MTHIPRSDDWWEGYYYALADVDYHASKQQWPGPIIQAVQTVTNRIRHAMNPLRTRDVFRGVRPVDDVDVDMAAEQAGLFGEVRGSD